MSVKKSLVPFNCCLGIKEHFPEDKSFAPHLIACQSTAAVFWKDLLASSLKPRTRLLGSQNFRVRFSEFRVQSVPVNSEVETRKFIEM